MFMFNCFNDDFEKTTFSNWAFPGGTSGKEPACQWRRLKRHGFDSWVRKTPWRRKWKPTPVFLPGESPWTEKPGRLQSMGSHRVGHDWSNSACTLSNRNWHNVPYFKKGKLYSKQKLSDFWVIILHRSTKCLWNHGCLPG